MGSDRGTRAVRLGRMAVAAAACASIVSAVLPSRCAAENGIRSQISPRICTLTGNDK
ncbi:hypothetical protein OY671_013045, partial [Metschnikowia pulcherrima]